MASILTGEALAHSKGSKAVKNREALDQFVAPPVVADFDRLATAAYGRLRRTLEKKGQMIGAMICSLPSTHRARDLPAAIVRPRTVRQTGPGRRLGVQWRQMARTPPLEIGPRDRDRMRAWLDNWERVGPILERDRWDALRAMTEDEACAAARQLFELWRPDWPSDEGESLLLHQRVFARGRTRE